MISRLPNHCFRLICAVACLAAPAAAAYGQVSPRFQNDAASALARDSMQVIETPDMLLIFPSQSQGQAMRFLARTEGCAHQLNKHKQLHNGMADGKIRVVFADLPYNNADVSPRVAGIETLALIPTYDTVDLTPELGMFDQGFVACHELTHYVHLTQIGGLPWLVNAVLGELVTPQLGLDPWFWEGLAVYYETALLPGTGRLAWPYWLGSFAAGVAGRRLNGGDLNLRKRDYHFSNHYLIGSHFIRFLVEKYGEDKLWRLIALQGRSPFIVLGINVQFWRAYDKSLSTLIDEFADDTSARYPVRTRPLAQRTVFHAGISARYARAADGTQALIDEDHDRPAMLRILDAEGRVRASRHLTEILPPRKLDVADPRFTSGLSFTADGRALYFVAVDQGPTYQRARLLRYDLPRDELTVVASDLGGMGGAISPDGRGYLFVRPDGDRHDLAELDVASGAVRVLSRMASGSYLSAPRFSPDGTLIVASVMEEGHYGLALFDGKSGQRTKTLSTGKGPVVDASFVDQRRLVYLGTAENDGATPGDASGAGVGYQVLVHDLATDQARVVTRVPYLAFEPQAAGGRTVRFLNRDGWRWTIDEVDLPGPVAPAERLAAAATDPQASAPARSLPPLESPVVLSQRPYGRSWSSVPGPRLIGPSFRDITSSHRLFKLQVLGADRLNYHRWEAGVWYQPGSRLASYELAYRNGLLAPFLIDLDASQIQLRDWAPAPPPGGPPPTSPEVYERDRLLSAGVTRLFYDGIQAGRSPISVGAQLVESYRPDNTDAPLPLTRVAGPFVSFAYVGAETTRYTGVSRAIVTSLRVAAYPRSLSANELSFVDLNARLSGVLPLPLLRRHTLALAGVARTLPGAPADQPLLRIGGLVTSTVTRIPDNPVPDLPDPAQLPAQALLVEPLRGFEDYRLAANTFFSVAAAYRYPFIIDWGSASSLGVLPSFFLSQVDLELFAVAAQTRTGDSVSNHQAVGASLGLRVALWILPLQMRYQMTRRLSDDHAWAGFLDVAVLLL